MKRTGFIGFLALAFLLSSLAPALAQAKLPVIDAAMMPQHSTWPAYMAMKNVLLNVTYYDTRYNVDVGDETDYDRWQLDFNFTF